MFWPPGGTTAVAVVVVPIFCIPEEDGEWSGRGLLTTGFWSIVVGLVVEMASGDRGVGGLGMENCLAGTPEM